MRCGHFLAYGSVGDGGKSITIRERSAAGGASNQVLEVRGHVCLSYGGSRVLFELQRPLLNGTINLPQIVDAGILLVRRAGLDKVGNRNRRQ